MTTLSDRDILRFMDEGLLVIEDFIESNLTPNGYDLSIEEVYLSSNGARINEGTATVDPGKWFAVSTREYFALSRIINASLWIRTTFARKGIISSFGKVDAGFEGNLTLTAHNASRSPLYLDIGMRFAQIVFETLSSPPLEDYAKRSGNFQGQRGVTLK
jgi:dCTP deaminase